MLSELAKKFGGIVIETADLTKVNQETVKAFRDELGYTTRRMSKVLGVKEKHVKRFEKGGRMDVSVKLLYYLYMSDKRLLDKIYKTTRRSYENTISDNGSVR